MEGVENVVVEMLVGSRMYGTDTPESDFDYATVFIPSTRDILLGLNRRTPNVITGPTHYVEGVKHETTHYSIHQFLKMACEGQTIAMDMLHAPMSAMQHVPSATWAFLVNNKHRFYSKNLNAFTGFARSQANKYGVKGSRLEDLTAVVNYLQQSIDYFGNKPLGMSPVWCSLPTGEYIKKHEGQEHDSIPMLEVCGKKVHASATLVYAWNVFNGLRVQYGERVKAAASNNGIDWKALSHAVRVSIEVCELLTNGTIVLPLPQRDLVREIKEGKLDYLTVVGPLLDGIMDQNEKLLAKSSLPEKVDRVWWDDWLVGVLKDAI